MLVALCTRAVSVLGFSFGIVWGTPSLASLFFCSVIQVGLGQLGATRCVVSIIFGFAVFGRRLWHHAVRMRSREHPACCHVVLSFHGKCGSSDGCAVLHCFDVALVPSRVLLGGAGCAARFGVMRGCRWCWRGALRANKIFRVGTTQRMLGKH